MRRNALLFVALGTTLFSARCGGGPKPPTHTEAEPDPVDEWEADREAWANAPTIEVIAVECVPGSAAGINANFGDDANFGDFARWYAANACAVVLLDRELLSRPVRGPFAVRVGGPLEPVVFEALVHNTPIKGVSAGRNVFILSGNRSLVAFAPPLHSNPAGTSDPAAEPADDSVIPDGERHWRVRLDALEKLLDSEPRSFRLVPAVRNGKVSGFKLFAIRSGSVLARMGLQNGDTVLSVDGIELTDADRALEVVDRLRASRQKTMTVELLRRGQPVQHRYTLE